MLIGGEIDGAVSESLTLFLDLNRFEVVYYEYINRMKKLIHYLKIIIIFIEMACLD